MTRQVYEYLGHWIVSSNGVLKEFNTKQEAEEYLDFLDMMETA